MFTLAVYSKQAHEGRARRRGRRGFGGFPAGESELAAGYSAAVKVARRRRPVESSAHDEVNGTAWSGVDRKSVV